MKNFLFKLLFPREFKELAHVAMLKRQILSIGDTSLPHKVEAINADFYQEYLKLCAQMRNLSGFLASHFPHELEKAQINDTPLINLVQSIMLDFVAGVAARSGPNPPPARVFNSWQPVKQAYKKRKKNTGIKKESK